MALSVHGCLGKALEAYHAASVQNTGDEVEEFSVYVSSTITLLGGVGVKSWTARQTQGSHTVRLSSLFCYWAGSPLLKPQVPHLKIRSVTSFHR